MIQLETRSISNDASTVGSKSLQKGVGSDNIIISSPEPKAHR